ncbi:MULTISPECIES: single-stranded DNA-binding protein [unclassified Clostridium]|uniref:single-stranded DNA-binding protein n=1 Tax=unclassified Clostridium TaxID=2614128 RepID=UPI0002974EBE|nr:MULTISPECIES: single-stranded DNA-binding protein [unclassified Clostridium]EKQ55960.1 MAG: single stranded DNA-binding protein [Clostridium sp. Maddingley MBC34-26]
MNKVYLIGRVTKDLEPQQFDANERIYVKFTLAVNDYKSNTKEYTTNFINIVAFGRKAEILSQYITKGHKLSIEGKVRTGSYLDRNNIKKYTVDIILEDFDFIDNKSNVI